MVKKGKSRYVAKKGFGWALLFTALTLMSLVYGLSLINIYAFLLTMIFAAVGLYFVKISWVSCNSSKKKK